MSAPHQPPFKFNMWSFIFHHTFARGYTRIPILLSIPLVWKSWLEPFVEAEFKYLNKGHTQQELWDAIEKRTNERIAAKAA